MGLLVGWLVLAALTVGVSRAQVLTPPYFNLAEGRLIDASATCGYGVSEPELYCKLVGAHADYKDNPNVNIIQGQVCDYCDPNDPELDHPPQNAIDGTEKWWQSPPLSRGNSFNEVNLTIDLGQEFHVAYVFIKMANSPRPGIWALERSKDHGKTWQPWQFFADTPTDCIRYFGRETLEPISSDDSVTCETRFSTVVPLEGGEVVVSLLHDRPNANNFYNSTVLQDWTKATNIRLRLLRTKTLLGHLMFVARQDPTVTRRYYYSIRDISIGGRCVCNGHADTCDITDPNDKYKLLCRCQHFTCGAQCEQCCPGYVQKKWRPATTYTPNECEPCNCHDHTNECVYDEDIDRQGLSLDIHNRYEGGGVCQNCQHNTEGINCNRCKAGFFRPYGKSMNATDVCHQCDCDVFFSTGSCFEGSGQCECRPEFLSPLCDQCAIGYFGFPNCRPCDCHLNGTRGFVCEVGGGQCPCKPNYTGKNCDECTQGFYNFPECLPCDCNLQGSYDELCDVVTGQCKCNTNYGGRTCSRCDDGYYDYPNCKFCSCDVTGCVAEVCNKTNGVCICKEGFGGLRCDRCAPGYYGYPHCKPCNCNPVGSMGNTCDDLGKCSCLYNFAGLQCDHCLAGFYHYPTCKPCNCDSSGSLGVSCENDGRCQCRPNFGGLNCDSCREGFYNFPACEECNCNPAGVLETFAGCGSLPVGELCQCKERVSGRICNQCRALYWNLQAANPFGCEECNCHLAGTIGGLNICDGVSGQCVCKPNTMSRQCDTCEDGTFNLQEANLFGCVDCDCNIGGSVTKICDKISGQCSCHPRISGRRCDEPTQLHYFPTLYQHQYELEDGFTPAFNPARFGYSEDVFPGYSWRGYAIFSPLQKEVLTRLNIDRPSLYRVVLRYINHREETVIGHVTFTPDTYGEIKQTSAVRFEPSSVPKHITVAGEAKGGNPTHFVINPGSWTVAVKIDKPIYIDYFVLLPAAFYEATLLQERVNAPCKVDTLNDANCRHYMYPDVSEYSTVRGEAGYVIVGEEKERTQRYSDFNLLELLGVGDEMALLNFKQRELLVELSLPKAGRYALVIVYHTPEGGKTSVLQVDTTSTTGRDKGRTILYDCMYTTLCRQAVTDPSGRVAIFNFESNNVIIHLSSPEDITVAIESIVAIPSRHWSVDFITPKPSCLKQDGDCIEGSFQTIPDVVKVEMEAGANEEKKASQFPATLLNPDVGLIYLDHKDALVDIRGSVSKPGAYVFVVHYYQPKHSEFDLEVNIENGQFHKAIVPVPFCPSVSGCRSVIKDKSGEISLQVVENFTMTFKEPNHKSVWLDYVLAIPAEIYKPELLQEISLDRAGEFIANCGKDHFFIDPSITGFCREATFALTTEYNHGGLPCHCNFEGSLSFECDTYGGKCLCKPDVIGRSCTECRTGYFGFPNCHACACPSTAVCHPQTGECICPPRVTGENCDSCLINTYGFDPIIGCEECNCDPLGVEDNNLQCDSLLGQCECRVNVVGRTCSSCKAGYWSFPFCQLCNCDLRGTTKEICDMENARCFCKENVYGPNCEQCKPSTFHLQENNPLGCTKCFCFGRTNRCTSGNLYRTQIHELDGWEVVFLEPDTANVQPPEKIKVETKVRFVRVQLKGKKHTENVVYFSAPSQYLGNKITSYDGFLRYDLIFNLDDKVENTPLSLPDVIFVGGNISLVYEHEEQPSSGELFEARLPILETNFHMLNGGPVTREQLMVVLVNLQKIYIRGQYFTGTKEIKLESIMLDTTSSQYIADSSEAFSVEQCVCPPNYQGLSCEDCAPGYYRSQTGSYGGTCVPCQCHGHTNECDPLTGKCFNCNHNTTGEHCEKCAIGFQGNATLGSAYDCFICACPLPTMANNFAISCEVSPTGREIRCECREGYFGPRCGFCAAGYYGRPDQPNEICRPCNCSGNIDSTNFGSCDSQTGECLQCLNNTYGQACELCAPGYFGDAVETKNCKRCNCNSCGTRECHHSSGICRCLPNVIGEKCDDCAPGYYNFDSCKGCTACDCSDASESTQCDVNTGQCKCRNGVGGQRCDHCLPGFWNYQPAGCQSCRCNQDYSTGGSCNPATGQCECLPGVIGENCDRCPHRWVLIDNVGCRECDLCIHFLLDDMQAMNLEFSLTYQNIKNLSASYFANQRLNHINKTIFDLKILVNLAKPDSSGISLGPLETLLKKLEDETQDLSINSEALIASSEFTTESAEKTRLDATELQRKASEIAQTVAVILDEINKLAHQIVAVSAPDVNRKITEAEQWLVEIVQRNFALQRTTCAAEGFAANQTYDDAKKFSNLIGKVVNLRKEMGQRISDLDKRLRDVMNISQTVIGQAKRVATIYDSKSLNILKLRIEEVEANLENIKQTLINSTSRNFDARRLLDSAKWDFEKIFEEQLLQLLEYINILQKYVDKLEEELRPLYTVVHNAEAHAKRLKKRADDLQNLLTDTQKSSESAIRAANAYKDIVEAINEAQKAAEIAVESADKAKEDSAGLDDRAKDSKKISEELLKRANELSKRLRPGLSDRLAEARRGVALVEEMNKKTKGGLAEIQREKNRLSIHGLAAKAENAINISNIANNKALNAQRIERDIKLKLPNDKIRAEQVIRDVSEAKKAITRANKRIQEAREKVPTLLRLMDRLGNKSLRVDAMRIDVSEKMAELKRRIALARVSASRITLGVQTTPDFALQLRNPEGLNDAATHNAISLYFKTKEKNGFLMYMGNEIGTHKTLRRTETDDFMAIGIENGKVVVKADLGSGVGNVYNRKIVNNNVWHQVIVERTGKSITVTVKSENDTEVIDNGYLPGTHGVFNLNQYLSKIYIGGIPAHAKIQDAIIHRHFVGELDSFTLDNNPMGMWNFIYGEENREGCFRDQLVFEEPTSGLRFDGTGYAIMPATGHNFKTIVGIVFQFKTYAKDGLMIFFGKRSEFFSVELRDGHVVFQFNLGSGTLKMTSKAGKLNNGHWHSVQAMRIRKKAHLWVDAVQSEGEAPGIKEDLSYTNEIFVGGYRGNHSITEVTNLDFEGCIEGLTIGTKLLNLNEYVEALGVVAGCPEKISRIISFSEDSTGYLELAGQSLRGYTQFTFKFKTVESSGLFFYMANRDQTNYFSLSLDNGNIVFRMKPGGEVRSQKTYNDQEWHFVAATRNRDILRLDIDDFDFFESKTTDQREMQLTSSLFVAGLPTDLGTVSSASTASSDFFIGCLGDAAINGVFINFANATQASVGLLASCPLADPPPTVLLPPEPYPSVTFPPERTTRQPGTRRTPTPRPLGPRPPVTATPTSGRCALPLWPADDPDVTEADGLRFGIEEHTRQEYSIESKDFKSTTNLSIEFKTASGMGLLFYLTDNKQADFVAVYLKDGKLYFAYNMGGGTTILFSNREYNDDNWHKVLIVRQQKIGLLTIDGTRVSEGTSDGPLVTMDAINPLYVGGLSPALHDAARRHLKNAFVSHFSGCLRNVLIGSARTRILLRDVDTLPCSSKVEPGSFFSPKGGRLILFDKYEVGAELDVTMKIKARDISGVLMAVHGKQGDYVALQLLDGNIKFSIDNGNGPLTAVYYPENKYTVCDGNWHEIKAIKSKNVLMLSFDGDFADPQFGEGAYEFTDTNDPLNFGGVPTPTRTKGIETAQQFIGCIGNIEFNNKNYDFVNAHRVGNVSVGICPTI